MGSKFQMLMNIQILKITLSFLLSALVSQFMLIHSQFQLLHSMVKTKSWLILAVMGTAKMVQSVKVLATSVRV